ncbi:hypothetical protein [Tsukamurella pulmonis]|uniref:hypothetical protein n=1 Tax=Tsukamurella pulmonis TaxID=47312 RepID=UPI0011142C8C|nr:hypothetical protein [Tsukamurella pulmonis]
MTDMSTTASLLVNPLPSLSAGDKIRSAWTADADAEVDADGADGHASHPLRSLMAATQVAPADRRSVVENPYAVTALAVSSTAVHRSADTVER